MSFDACRNCGTSEVDTLIDLGRQPVSSRFSPDPVPTQDLFPLVLGQCPHCGLIQLRAAFPLAALRPERPMVYREPESHLDAVSERLAALPGRSGERVAMGLTYKDDSTLRRLAQLGLQCWRPEPAEVGAVHPFANVESIQSSFGVDVASHLQRTRGSADLIVVRHLLEHCERPGRLLQALSALLNDGGHVVIEVPDCSKSLRLGDYTMIWEEHLCYFTPASLNNMLVRAGFQVIELTVEPCPYEDLIVAIVRPASPAAPVPAAKVESGHDYAAGYSRRTRDLQAWCARQRACGRPLSLFGAGHLTTAFVNFHGLGDYFSFVVDDNEWKVGTLLPGTRLPVVPSSRLPALGGICLMGLGPGSEAAVIARNGDFVAGGGEFRSLLRDSTLALAEGGV